MTSESKTRRDTGSSPSGGRGAQHANQRVVRKSEKSELVGSDAEAHTSVCEERPEGVGQAARQPSPRIGQLGDVYLTTPSGQSLDSLKKARNWLGLLADNAADPTEVGATAGSSPRARTLLDHCRRPAACRVLAHPRACVRADP